MTPCLCENNYGGIQLAGRIVRDRLKQEPGKREFRCLGYGIGGRTHSDPECSFLEIRRDGESSFSARFRRDLALLACWHAGSFWPLLGRRHTRTYLFLHGIECWTTLDSVTQSLLKFVDTFLVNSAFTWSKFVENNPRWANSDHQVVGLGTGFARCE